MWLNALGIGGAMSFLLGVEQIGEAINKLLIGLMLGYAFTDSCAGYCKVTVAVCRYLECGAVLLCLAPIAYMGVVDSPTRLREPKADVVERRVSYRRLLRMLLRPRLIVVA